MGDPSTTVGTDPFFAPDRTSRTRRPRRPVTLRRLLVRFAVCVLALLALDRVIAPAFAPPSTYLHDYRLPREAPTTALADYANAIDLAAREPSRAPIAIFLGASPTYGHRIKNAADTFPAAFASAAASAGTPVQAFNLAANGQFVGDYYVLERRLLGDADIVLVQLTYHTFSPAGRGGLHIRYPELPAMLGVDLPPRDASLLGLTPSGDASATPPPPAAVGSVLSRWWTLWRERDLIDRRLFKGSPRQAMSDLAARLTGSSPAPAKTPTATTLPDDAADDGFASFGELDPARQMVVVARYAELSSFTVDPTDSEMILLDRLAADIATAHKKAVFFMGPLNWDAISTYELIDPAQYDRNIALLRSTVGRHGFTLIDHNADGTGLSASDFADISHTTDAGGAAFGQLLLRDTLSYLRSATP
jgi:hypothetical protein